jgi:hypothetical protein
LADELLLKPVLPQQAGAKLPHLALIRITCDAANAFL